MNMNNASGSICLADSHCHVDFDGYDMGPQELIQAARAAGVRYLLNVSVDVANWERVLSLANTDLDVYASVGVHPNEEHVPTQEPDVDTLVAMAQRPKVVAIGETGLDYYRGDASQKAMQHERFRTHIRAARQAGLPLIIHTRAAAEDTLAIMAEEGAEAVGGVMHCFAESWEVAQAALAMGFYISFSGIVTFKSATELQEVARRVPADRMLVETDSPFLAPVPYRGKTNQPAYVLEVAQKVADLRGIDLATVAAQTTDNFLRLFRIQAQAA